MIGIVVVSHSPALAHAAVDLAGQVAGRDGGPRVRVAAGTPDGQLGTDAVAIAAAIDEAATGDGVLVLMDLGSAILSAEMAREFTSTADRVVLSPAPFVEGLVSAVVLASTGAGLDAVVAEVGGALDAKRAQLGADAPAAPAPMPETLPDDDEPAWEGVVRNPSGLHARPAATFARTAGTFDAAVRVQDLDAGGAPAAGNSLLALMSLGVRPGTRVRVSAVGPEAAAAVEALARLIDDGFGEL